MIMRSMTEDDLNQVISLENKLYVKPWLEKDYLYEINENPFAYYFVLEHEEEIIGYVGFWITFETAQITKVSVNPKYQGRKISYILLEDIENRIKKANCNNITLEVRVSNTIAIHVYQRCGFNIATVRRNYYDNNEDAYLMIKELKENDNLSNRE